ncbi:hypothetical protein DSO57_1003531 [Entomophthora muscae]|uniref:Uncharacterized protein n=1 Tax=Entomophthora muscae TaxID=34485 RepID=A0ACC2SAG2_9FUNG|nr:hypothetical protein DSO57_1003531 [Entomophthora muscae]
MVLSLFFCLPCRDNPSSLLHLPGALLLSGKTIFKSLTCDDLDFHAINHTVSASALKEIPMPALSSLEGSDLVPPQAPVKLSHPPTQMPWLLAGLVLMGLNAYFPQLSPVSSLWSPLQAALPVLHWAASWWYILLGWKPNLNNQLALPLPAF